MDNRVSQAKKAFAQLELAAINALSASAKISFARAKQRVIAERKRLETWGEVAYRNDGQMIIYSDYELDFDILPKHIRNAVRLDPKLCVMSLAAMDSDLKPLISSAMTGNVTLKLAGKLNDKITLKFWIKGLERDQIRTYDEGAPWTLEWARVYPSSRHIRPKTKRAATVNARPGPKKTPTRRGKFRYGTVN